MRHERIYIAGSLLADCISFEDESKRDDFDVTCTGCGALFGAESRDDAEIVIMGRWDYCPFCGAKMDLEG